MTRKLQTLDSGDVAAVLRALRDALTGDGPAVLPRQAGGLSGDHLPSTVAQNIALVIETSGSTGAPKRVALSADALLASAAASAGAVGGQGQWLLCLPAHYVAGTNVLVRSIAADTAPVVMPVGHFDPLVFGSAAAELTGDERYVSLVPAQLSRLVNAATDDRRLLAVLRSFDRMLVGGQSLPPVLRERAIDLGLSVTRTYGSSETCGGCVYDGMPIGPVRARALDGSLELAGPVLAEGYLGDDARTEAAFHDAVGTRWYRTGDLGSVDAVGRVTVLGRADNVIISGGEKVSLDAVERSVRELTGFTGAVVVEAESEQWGQVPVVVTAVDDSGNGNAATLQQLRSHVSAALGRAAAPARIVVVETIPRLASGKPDRRAIAQAVRAEA